MYQNQRYKLTESLRRGDLKDFVDDLFTVDQYRSKMGEDSDVVVLSFKIKERYPAIDLMEFIEKGYDFILDADMSPGEEHDGQYQVFAEIERTIDLPKQLKELLNGIGQLCDNQQWRFKYYRSLNTVEFNNENILTEIPLTKESYENKILTIKESDIKEFFNQGAVDVRLESDNNIIFRKPYAGDISAKFVAIGDYDDVKDVLPGKISLDESSQCQVLFLNKYIGNYDINKIDNKFLIRNGKKAVIIEKNKW